MDSHYSTRYSSALGHEVQMLRFGHSGIPVILFPTSMGQFTQSRDFGLVDTASYLLDNGSIRIYCPESFDAENLYNKDISPEMRIQSYMKYENMVSRELIPFIQAETGFNRVILAGCSFGGFHAANTCFKHPELVSYLFCMSGVFDIRMQMDGYYNEDMYFNDPALFLPGLQNPALNKIGIALGAGEHDICLQANKEFSDLLLRKNIDHWLDIRPGAVHDWPVWREMFPHYLSKIELMQV